MAELREIGEWKTGSTPSRSRDDYWGGDILWVSPKDMKTDRIVETEDRMTEQALEETNSKIIPPGSLIMVTRSGILEHSFPVAINEKPVTINQDLKALIPSSRVTPEYLYYSLRSNEIEILKNCSKDGTTVASLNSDSLYSYDIPLPPISEQEHIVEKIEEFLTKLDAGVSELQVADQTLDQYRLSLLKSAFEGRLSKTPRDTNGWEVTEDFDSPDDIPDILKIPSEWRWIKAQEVIDSMRNGIYKPEEYYNDDGIASLRMYNIDDGQIVWKDIKRMELTQEEREKFGLEPGDLLVNRVNSRELVGKAAPIPDGIEECVYESKNIRVRLNQHIRGEYLGYWFYLFRKHYFMKQVKQTVGQATITQSQINEMPVPLAPISEQDVILNEIDRQDSILSDIDKELERNLTRATRLRQSILHQACEGKFSSPDHSDEYAGAPPLSSVTSQGRGEQKTLQEVTRDAE